MAAGMRNVERLNPRRVEWAAAFGLMLQAVATLVVLLMSWAAGGWALSILTVQAAAGLLFWGLCLLHLRLRRSAREETEESERLERGRKAAGMESLFDEPEIGQAARNLRQMERYLVPVASVVVALILLLPTLRFFLAGTTPWAALRADPGTMTDNALLCAFVSLGAAFLLFLCGMYAGGLARGRDASSIRAGGGYMLSTALGFVLAAGVLFTGSREWGRNWPDDLAAGLLMSWMILQGLEILCNLVLDIYRPRVAGVEFRPAYDSRLSGLFAEPTGLFRTFAHTMDYQFGFKISETWFFHFLERAFAPLLLVWLLTFYLLTSLVVVRQGEAVIIERFGAPRGLTALPENDADWDTQLPEPLGPGLHLKLPWPLETARVLPRNKINLLFAGFGAASEAEAEKKATELFAKLTSWEAEHIADENFYLMPMPVEMRIDEAAFAAAAADPDAAAVTGGENMAAVDALFLSGSFTMLYRVGAKPGDPYRFLYRGQEPVAALRTIFEREITAHLAGAKFWDLLVDRPGDTEQAILAAANRSAARFGLEVLSVQVVNLHPPTGDVGKAFQEVLSARQEQQTTILNAEAQAKQTIGLIPSQTHAVIADAKSEQHRQVTLARSEAELFRSQLEAFNAAPDVFIYRARNDALAKALSSAGEIVIHPPGMEVRLDRTKMPTAAEAEMFKGLIGEVQKENRNR